MNFNKIKTATQNLKNQFNSPTAAFLNVDNPEVKAEVRLYTKKSPAFHLKFVSATTNKIMETLILEKLDELTKMLTLQRAQTNEILTLDEAAYFLGLSKSQVYKLTSTRQIPYYCPNGKKCYFLKADLSEWMLRFRKATFEEIKNTAVTNTSTSRRR
ncbi:helix-turn-helix domain-containing protein [Pontibacter beigongshangensis]|uniref:helix-turn-helix domain-containing protein n=1 Tax=Pontibacter beigongshangensis TaxID=2574733 RepID=UPI0019D5D20E|nr:helix-turn-helix domain-containing protein [Pontibacter beigongshangensis]